MVIVQVIYIYCDRSRDENTQKLKAVLFGFTFASLSLFISSRFLLFSFSSLAYIPQAL